MTWLLLTPNNVTISYTQNMLMQNDIAIEKEKAWSNGSGSIYFRERPYRQPCCRVYNQGKLAS